jgi:hypothetical protein
LALAVQQVQVAIQLRAEVAQCLHLVQLFLQQVAVAVCHIVGWVLLALRVVVE